MAHAQWLGGPTVLLRLNNFTILTDPMFGEGPNAFIMNGHPSTGEQKANISRAAPLPEIDLKEIDLVLVSHLHSDHFDKVARERLDKTIPILAPTVQVQRIVDWGFKNVNGLDWGQEFGLESNSINIVAVPAQHSADPETNKNLGIVNGYLIDYLENGISKTIYWTGDTVWFEGFHEIMENAPKVDMLIPHLGAVGDGGPWGRMTMNAEEGLELVRLFEPKIVFPIHHHTFSHYVEPVDVFQDAILDGYVKTELKILPEGGGFEW